MNLALAFVPTLAEVIEILTAKNIYDPTEISDLSVGMFNSMFSLGNLIAPLLGGTLNYCYSYSTTCDTMAVLSLGFAILFYLTMIFNRKFVWLFPVFNTS